MPDAALEDEIEYRYVRGQGWVASLKPNTVTITGVMSYAQVGCTVSGPDGIIGTVSSYDPSTGIATISLTLPPVRMVTITGTVEI